MKRIPVGIYLTGSVVISVLTLMAACSDLSRSGNWPQFRGPEANMVVKGEKLPAKWGDDLNMAWTYVLEGEGWASPVIWENQVLVATVVAETINKPGEGEEDNQDLFRSDVYRWELTSVDLETGEALWKKMVHRGNPTIQKHSRTNYASETPVTDGERIYLYIGMIGLYCFDMGGELLWEKDLGAFETQNGWGTGSSPLLYEGRLYVQVDNEVQSFLVALDAASGEEIWKVERDEITGYSTPFIWKNRERSELVTGGMTARSYDPETGELHWELELKGRRSIPGPVATKDLLFLGNVEHRTRPGTFFAVKAGADGNITPDSTSGESEGIAWFHEGIATGNPSPLLHEGLIYLLESGGRGLICLEAETGKIIYQENLDGLAACWASPWANQDWIFLMDEKGVTRVIGAGRSFEHLHDNKLDDRFWASMASNGEVYILKGDKKLYCIKQEGI